MIPQKVIKMTGLKHTRNGIIVTNTSSIQTIWTDIISGSKNKDWRVKVAKKQDATSPYTRQHVNVSGDIGVDLKWREPSPFYPYYYDNVLNQYYSVIETPNQSFAKATDSATKDIALKRLKNRLSNDVGGGQHLAGLVELRELPGLTRSLSGLTIKALKSLDVASTRYKPLALLKWASDSWLTYSFGAAPLVGEISDVITEIQNYLDREDKVVRQRGGAHKHWTSTLSAEDYIPTTGTLARVRNYLTYKLSYLYIACRTLDLKSSNNYSAFEHLGLDFPTGFVPTLYELMPYSWLIDYFTTLGDYIGDSFESPPGTTRYVVLNTKFEFTNNVSFEYPHQLPTGSTVQSFQPKPGKLDGFLFKREAIAGIPHRALRIKTLDEISSNAVNRVLNLASLLGSRRGRY